MFKKIFTLSTILLVIMLVGCRPSAEEIPEDEYENYEEEDDVELDPTAQDLRAEFETFFEQNRESIIESIATEGEDIRLELAAGYEFIMSIVADDIELDDDNIVLHVLTFELTFSDMAVLFGGLAEEIREAADINHFRLTVVFLDVNEVEIARSSFDAGDRTIGHQPASVDDDSDTD